MCSIPEEPPTYPPRSPPTLYEMLVPFLSQDIICICLREWEMGEIGERRSVAASYYHITQCHLTHNIVPRITYHRASFYHITQCRYIVSRITFSLLLPYYPMLAYSLLYYLPYYPMPMPKLVFPKLTRLPHLPFAVGVYFVV